MSAAESDGVGVRSQEAVYAAGLLDRGVYGAARPLGPKALQDGLFCAGIVVDARRVAT